MLRFVILSLAVHLLAVGMFYYRQPQHDAMPTPGTLSVHLQTVSQPASRKLQPPTPLTHHPGGAEPVQNRRAMAQADSIRSIEPEHPAADERQAAETPARNEAADENKAETAQARVTETDMQDSLRSVVYRELHAHFSYPRRARQMGWEGTVVIALRILPDGKLADIRVAGSSGIATLDRAAIASLSKVSAPRLVALMHGRELDMTIPVEYRLTDG